MPISSLPNELLHLLLIHCIIVRGAKRGVRLRLVCKRFDDMFIPALYQSHILDYFSALYIGCEWWLRNDLSGSIMLWHGYLVFRVLGERNPDVGRFVEIRNTAEALHDLADGALPLDEIVRSLCWLALERGTNCPGERLLWLKGCSYERWVVYPDRYPSTFECALERQRDSGESTPPSNAQLDLLCGAAYFNLVSVAESLLQESNGPSPTDPGGLLPSPMWIASFRGHATMLDLFQRHILSSAPYTFSDDQSYFNWANENTPDAIPGAIINRKLNVLLSVLFPPSVRLFPPAISEVAKCTHGQYPMDIYYHRGFSPNPAMYDFINNTFPDIYDEDRRIRSRQRDEVARYARDGNLVMVRYLLGASKKVQNGGFVRAGNPLYRACQGGYDDLVEFLLDRNAKYNDHVLFKAIKVGSVKILRRLLEYDATVHNHDRGFPHELLAEIILAENMAILELVLERGYRVTKERHEDAMSSAIADGLESMVDCLEGVRIV